MAHDWWWRVTESQTTKKFAPGEYVVVNTGGGDRVALVVHDWWTTLPHEIRVDFSHYAGSAHDAHHNGSRLDLWQDSARLATDQEIRDATVTHDPTEAGGGA
jgi:hypothetical protein